MNEMSEWLRFLVKSIIVTLSSVLMILLLSFLYVRFSPQAINGARNEELLNKVDSAMTATEVINILGEPMTRKGGGKFYGSYSVYDSDSVYVYELPPFSDYEDARISFKVDSIKNKNEMRVVYKVP